MIRRPPRSTLSSSSAASDVYKRQPTNIRRSFYGALLEYRDDVFIFRGFAAKAVLIYPGLFDDPTSSSEAFRGFYLRTRRLFSLPVSVDLYLLDKRCRARYEWSPHV